MTVAQLIEKLNKMPQEAETGVYVSGVLYGGFRKTRSVKYDEKTGFVVIGYEHLRVDHDYD